MRIFLRGDDLFPFLTGSSMVLEHNDFF